MNTLLSLGSVVEILTWGLVVVSSGKFGSWNV